MSAKKAPDLSSLLVTSKGAATPSVGVPQRGAESPSSGSKQVRTKERKTESKNEKPLNFKVSETFYREFRQYAAAHDMKLNELLRIAFETLKRTEP